MKLTLPKVGTWSPSGFPKIQSSSQNTSHWGVLYTIEKFLKCRCPKWPRMSHLDICNSSYEQKKGRESNCQFDSRPLKVGNQPESDIYRRSATWRWKALQESYKIASDLIPIWGLRKKLWMPKVPGIQTGTVSRLLLGSLGKKCHSDVASVESYREYYKGGRWWLPLSPGRGESSESKVACGLSQQQKGAEWILTNLLIDFGCRTE
jgi:hypothetical protein